MGEPKRPADLLGAILSQAKASAGTARARRALAEVLGLAAAHCRVVSQRSGRLLVDVDSAPLYAELQGFRREEVRRALNERLGDKIAEVTFRLHGDAVE